MSLWAIDAATSKFCVPFPTEPSQRRPLRRISTTCAQVVCPIPFIPLYHISPLLRTGVNLSSTRSKLGREDIKWQELLQHFRAVQMRHEKARRQALGTDVTSFIAHTNGIDSNKPPTPPSGPSAGAMPPSARRKMTVDGPLRPPSRTGGMLSPLNPKSRAQNTAGAGVPGPQPPGSPTASASQSQAQAKVKRALSLSRKT